MNELMIGSLYFSNNEYGGLQVSRSHLLTNLEYSIVSREAFEIYAVNHDVNPMDYILNLDAYSYYMMNILDYLVGNTDRHWGNWGFLVDNRTGQTAASYGSGLPNGSRECLC